MFKVLTERKPPFNYDAMSIKDEIENYLKIPNITGVRVFSGYHINGVTQEVFLEAKNAIFCQGGRTLYENTLDLDGDPYIIDIEYLPGQYDQRADQTARLIKLINPGASPSVKTYRKIALFGELSQCHIEKIKSYLINPVESREVPLNTNSILDSEPDSVEIIEGFINFTNEELAACKNRCDIAMSMENFTLCQNYFKDENRNPSLTELKVLDVYWSDHCRHSTFLTVLENISVEENPLYKGLNKSQKLLEEAWKYVYGADSQRPLCLMDIATLEMKKLKKTGALNDMEDSGEVNACSIEVTASVDGAEEDYIIMFKNETHNHPTEMEPFGGASTCLGGGIRDPLSGRAHVFGAIRVTGSGDPREPVEDTLPGKLPQRKITKTAADGYSFYGNQIGLASGYLQEFYDPGFKAKRMECGALVAAVPKKNITRKEAVPGDIIVLLGANTGRDGLGGATGSSKEQDENALEKGGAEVQKGNPLIERNIVRLFRNPKAAKMIKKCNDFGAGGVSVAVGEMADGLRIDLDKVPVKYPGLDGTELAISESQERMAVLLDPSNLEYFRELARLENLNAVQIAQVTEEKRVIMYWKGKIIADLSRDFLDCGGVRQKSNVSVKSPQWNLSPKTLSNIEKDWLDNLADLNVCSKKSIASQFDQTAGNTTVFMPFGGKYQKTPESGLAMRLPLVHGKTDFTTLMTVGYNPELCYKSPFHAALYAVIESVSRIAAMGGDYNKIRLSFQEYFEKLGDDPEKWGKPYAALMGAFLAMDKLEIPSIGGKDSMSGTFMDINVPPSLISFAVACISGGELISRAFKSTGSTVVLVKTPIDESGIPDFESYKKNLDTIYKLVKERKVKAASVIGAGGIGGAISEMAFGNGIGFKFDKNWNNGLFSPDYPSFILELEESLGFEILGHTIEEKVIIINGVSISLDKAEAAWGSVLENLFPTEEIGNTAALSHPDIAEKAVNSSTANVLIPIFPGTNGEYEMERQFAKAGGKVETFLFLDQTPTEIEESIVKLAAAIDKCHILALPSGMSAEPDGGGKFMAIVLKKPAVIDAVNNLIKRGGLILGIGEGMNALLKTGLIQKGYIDKQFEENIFMNKLPKDRYLCHLTETTIAGAPLPWFVGMENTTWTVPFSALEGVMCISNDDYQKYSPLIAAKYTHSGSIDAMVSHNRQVLGINSAVDRLEPGLYVNVFNAADFPLFRNAVNYINNNNASEV